MQTEVSVALLKLFAIYQVESLQPTEMVVRNSVTVLTEMI